ncbi:MAG: glutathione-disulfide reductase [Cypionkella sp.]|nr:glutathione-disulfide reductase [Cypionkella sp.]
MAFDVDLFVIGGGSGGVRAARMAAATGAKVALAEESRMGGTCVIRGCVPKKLMVFASSFREMPGEARAYGWDIPDGSFDWGAFRGKLHAELDRLEGVYRRLLEGSGVVVHSQRARLVAAHEVELADGQRISARHILIATGGRPERPDLPNAHLGLVSDDIFLLERLPTSILIVGGGFIACEMACILNGLGVQVTQFYRGAQILRGFDDEARGLVAEAMRAQGIDLHLGTNIVAMAEAEAMAGAARGGEAGHAAALLPKGGAKGAPVWVKATNGYLGVEIGRRGEIKVDAYSQTGVPSVFAIGDVTDRVNLTPVAIREGMAFTRTVFEGQPTPVDHDLIPMAVFTQPELGTVGLTEEAARERGPIEVYATSFKPMRSSFAGEPARVLMKLIVCAETRRVLGCHIVAPEAGEMIQLAAIAVKMGATKEDFDRTVAVHPTMAEELVTMRAPVRRA